MADDGKSRRAAAEAESSSGEGGKAPRPRKRRRWLRRLLIALAVVVVLIGLTPYLVSTGAGTDMVLSLVNPRLKGEVEIGDLSVCWLGPTVITDFRVIDPQGREALHVPEIRWSGGVWRGILSGERFGEVVVDGPEVVLYVGSDGKISLAEAFESPPKPDEPEDREKKKKEEQDEGLPQPVGTFSLRSATVTLKREGAEDVVVRNIGLEVTVKTLDAIWGTFAAESVAGRVQAKFEVRDLASGGEVDVLAASGSFDLESKGALNVGALAAMCGRKDVSGTAALTLRSVFAPGKQTADLELVVSKLMAPRVGEKGIKPIDLRLTGRIDHAGGKADGRLTLGGLIGTVTTVVSFRTDKLPGKIDPKDVAAALLTGEPLELPEFSVQMDGGLDLAALARAVPGLLNVRKGVSVTAGRLSFEGIRLAGGSAPSAKGRLALRGLAGDRDGRPIRFGPTELSFDVALTTGTGLEIRLAKLTSDFADLRASGTASAVEGRFNADLAKLHGQLNDVFDLGEFQLAGAVSGSVKSARAKDGRLDVTVSGSAEKLKYSMGEKALDIASALFSHKAEVVFDGQKPKRVTITESTLSVADKAVARATGFYDVATGGFGGRVALTADLARCLAVAAPFMKKKLPALAGRLTVEATITRQPGAEELLAAFALAAEGLTADGVALHEPGRNIELKLTGARVAVKAKRFALASASLTGAPVSLAASNVRGALGDDLVAQGHVELTGDIRRCLAAAKPFRPLFEEPQKPEDGEAKAKAKKDKPIEVGGRFHWKGDATTSGGRIKLIGGGAVKPFNLTRDGKLVRYDEIVLALKSGVDPKAERLDLTCRADAFRWRPAGVPRPTGERPVVTVTVAGSVAEFKTRRVLDLAGDYEADWRALTELMHTLNPKTKGNVDFKGRRRGKFTAKGPARQPDVRPDYRGLAAAAAFGWESGEVYAIPLGKATLSPALADGRVTLPLATIPVGQAGKIRLRADVDLTGEDPVLFIKAPLQVLEDVPLDIKRGKKDDNLLGLINPIFFNRMQCLARLEMSSVAMPLSGAAKTTGTADGRLELRDVKMESGGLLAQVLGMLGGNLVGLQDVKIDPLDFKIRDGRVAYKGLKVTVAGLYDMKFDGSVGFDKTLKLTVWLPVRPALLQRLGVPLPPGIARDTLEKLGHVPIFIGGTVDKPKYDLSQAKKELPAMLLKLLPGLLDGILGPKTKGDGKKRDPVDDLLDSIIDILGPKKTPEKTP